MADETKPTPVVPTVRDITNLISGAFADLTVYLREADVPDPHYVLARMDHIAGFLRMLPVPHAANGADASAEQRPN